VPKPVLNAYEPPQPPTKTNSHRSFKTALNTHPTKRIETQHKNDLRNTKKMYIKAPLQHNTCHKIQKSHFRKKLFISLCRTKKEAGNDNW